MTLREEKRRRLEAKGWRIGTAQEFLRLSPEEAAYIDLKVRLAISLRERRHADRPRKAPPIEPVAHRQDGGWRSLSIVGPSDKVAADPWGLAPGIVADYFCPLARPSRITSVSAAARRSVSCMPGLGGTFVGKP